MEDLVLDEILSGVARDLGAKRWRAMAEYTNANFSGDFKDTSVRLCGLALGL